MKRFLICVAFISVFGCDDGDLTVEDLNFDEATTQRCDNENIFYKIADNEALIVEFTDAQTATLFVEDPTIAGTPRTVEISSSTRVIYRSYSSDVTATTICGTIPPATPVVTEEWTASSGIIEITTTAVIGNNADLTGGERVTGYKHAIIFRNITFEKPSGSQLYETFSFGSFTDNSIAPIGLNFDGSLEKCPATNIIFDHVGSVEGMSLDIDPSLIQNVITPLGSPRTGLISQTVNKLTYQTFSNGTLPADYYCQTPVPSTPTVVQTWIGKDGVSTISGIIEVSTTTVGSDFIHEIHLINAYLKKGNTEFKLADDYLFGQLITN